ncbi:MAG: CehA/McbA family metallohydrolase [Planctomycetaceae bacterium]|nr:CehA/McbA family metallohydrolase [Planctomycetaceae bacterium]
MAKKPARFVNPFEIPGRWFKANLHTHTKTSDGHLTPADRVKQYRKAGYHVLALTDHNAVNDLKPLPNGRMLLVSGMEFHPKCPGHRNTYHLVALNVDAALKFKNLQANTFIRRVNAAGGAVVLAHPYWCGYQFEQFKDLKGLAAVEVYNRTCDNSGRACSENEWAYALEQGMHLPATAVDDVHHELQDAFGGWTMLKMKGLTAAGVIEAVKTGAFYSTCGPEIHDFRADGDKIVIRCSPVASIHFISTAPYGALLRAEPGKTVTEFAAEFKKDWWGNPLPFVRARVTDVNGRMAWTNPLYL